MSEYAQSMFFASRLVGGMHTSRSHKGDKDARPPLEMVDLAQQRAALKLLEQEMLSDEPFQFPPEIYNFFGPIQWHHWGSSPTARKDFPVHDFIAMWQERIIEQLLSPVTLERIHDNEMKLPPDQEVMTTAELIRRLTRTVFSEVQSVDGGEYTNRNPAISSLRRNLQRMYLRRLSNLAMGRTRAPEDCQTMAYAELSSLEGRIKRLLKKDVKLDSYSRAHLQESVSRIHKVLDARFSLTSP